MTLLDQLRAALGDRYTIERELGGGGMSVVFVAMEHALERRVVIKVLSPELGQTVNIDRFKREIATLATLQHPQIVPIFSAGQAGDLLYYMMPFVAGESLGARLARDRVLAPAEVIRLLTPLARALAFAHREGVVHRDIKPDNILLAQGEPVLADFGIAKVLREGSTHGTLTSSGMSIGTVTYMAPEQVTADPTIDGRADVYSLAAVGYELLAGSAPFVGTPQQVMSAHVVKAAPSLADSAPATPPGLRDVIARGLTKEAKDRPTAEEFAVMLEQAATSLDAPKRTASSRTMVLASVLLAVVAGAGWWMLSQRSASGVVGPAAVAVESRPGLAVLPFERIGGPEDAYIAAGLTDELMSQLAEVPELRVASRTTVRAYADSALSPTQLGARLDVRALVEGTVQRAGDQLRVSTRLVDVRDGSTLWSERYERRATDLFAVQREIGASVVAALAPRLGLSGRTGKSESGTGNSDAYDLFLRGRYALEQRGVDSLRSAITSFTRATTLDPNFARGYAGVAEAAALLPQYGGGGYAEVASTVRDASARALALDSTLAAPHMSLGVLAKGMGEWRNAKEEFDRALARQPDFAAAHQSLGELSYTRGDLDDAVRSFIRAAALEPANAAVVSEFAFVLVVNGQLDSAQRVVDRVLLRDPRIPFSHFTRALVLERKGDLAGAVRAMVAAEERAPLPLFLGSRVRLSRLAGDAASEADARRRLAAVATSPGTSLAAAIADIGVAPADSITALLERAVVERDPFIFQLPLRLWWFDPIRGSNGLSRVAQKLGLPPSAITK